ncbi:hypothetical protein EAE99_002746 [Botrytis elliptica]|nr:hypothetical protein EAE99_002746 [Botrytis elliptica]
MLPVSTNGVAQLNFSSERIMCLTPSNLILSIGSMASPHAYLGTEENKRRHGIIFHSHRES